MTPAPPAATPLATPNPATTDWVPLWNTGQTIPQTQPAVRVYRSTTQSIPNGAFTKISFDTVRYDQGPSPHWASGSPTRLTCQIPGIYQVYASIQFAPSTAGSQKMPLIYVNGTIISGVLNVAQILNASISPDTQVTSQIRLNAGDYVEAGVYQDTGSALNVLASDAGNNQFNCELGMALIGGMPGPPGIGVPSPVVNGQWIKGSGGAAIWAPITYSDLPVSLGQFNNGYSNYAADLNNCTQIGFYAFNPSTVNAPFAGYGTVHVLSLFDGTNCRQIAYQYNAEISYTRRRNDGGAWTAWYKGLPGVAGVETAAWPGQARMQVGSQSGTIGAAGHGGNSVTITLPTAWPNAHIFCIAQSWPGSTWSGYSGIISCLPNGLGAMYAQFENTASANNYTLMWLSIGY